MGLCSTSGQVELVNYTLETALGRRLLKTQEYQKRLDTAIRDGEGEDMKDKKDNKDKKGKTEDEGEDTDNEVLADEDSEEESESDSDSE